MKVVKWLSVLAVLTLVGCASWKSDSGVDNAWRAADATEWVVGKTTEAEVADALGPPSQLIGLENETVFYYLREHKQGKGLILLVWNWGYTSAIYDRAIFFFDKQGVLTKHSYSREALPHGSDQ